MFLNEAQSNYDIKKKYDYFNKLLFENKLPNDFKLTFKNTKLAGGAVVSTYWVKKSRGIKIVDRYEIKQLYLSTFYLRTEEQIDSILVHEMIHVYLMSNGLHEGYNCTLHGSEFTKKISELQPKLKFKIPLYDTPENSIDIANKKTSIEYGVVICDSGIGSTLSVFAANAFDSNYEKLKDIFTKHVKDGTTVIFGISTYYALEKYKIKRTVTSISLYEIKDEEKQSILNPNVFKETHRFTKDSKKEINKVQQKPNDSGNQKKEQVDKLFLLSMKLASSKPKSKEQLDLLKQVNDLRELLGMELI